MTGFSSRSLRTQLAILGTASVVIPILLLLIVFGSTSQEEQTVPTIVVDTKTETEPKTEAETRTETPQPQDEQSPEEEPVGTEGADTEGADTEAAGTGSITTTETSSIPREVVVAAAVLAGLAGGTIWIWAGRAVRPMNDITSLTNRIQLGSLDQRIDMDNGPAEVKALAQSFDKMLDRLASASTTQRQLIEDTSHELRTPLAALAMHNENILTKSDPTVDDYRANALRNEVLLNRVQATIEELLAGARSAGHLSERVDNDLIQLVERALQQFQTQHPGVAIQVEGPTSLRLGIDGPSVERAITNLLDNAARFAPEQVPIEVEVRAGDPTRDAAATLSITDHGPGITADDQVRLFDRYFRSGDGAPTAGTGIGLALVKQVADAHGSIEVVSPLADGSTGTRFVMTFDR